MSDESTIDSDHKALDEKVECSAMETDAYFGMKTFSRDTWNRFGLNLALIPTTSVGVSF